MTKKERLAELERRVAELEARPIYYQPYYYPWWGTTPPTYPPYFTTTTGFTTVLQEANSIVEGAMS